MKEYLLAFRSYKHDLNKKKKKLGWEYLNRQIFTYSKLLASYCIQYSETGFLVANCPFPNHIYLLAFNLQIHKLSSFKK